MTSNDFLTVAEASMIVKLTPVHLRKLLRAGHVKGARPRGRGSWRIPADELRRYLEGPAPARPQA